MIYPGGKGRLFKRLSEYIPRGTTEMVSPFFGGGAVELNLAVRGVKVYGYDVFEPLVNFWQHFLENSWDLIKAAKHIGVTESKEALKYKLKNFSDIEDSFLQAAYYYCCNRLSFSGKTFYGFSNYYVDKSNTLLKTSKKNRLDRVFPLNLNCWKLPQKYPLAITCADYQTSLSKHSDIFAYLDPPYPVITPLYRKNGQNKEIEHSDLANILHKRNNWILSYNDAPIIMELYKDCHKIDIMIQNSMCPNKQTHELLIFSDDLRENVERVNYNPQLSLFDFPDNPLPTHTP